VSCGWAHTLALTVDGQLYAWGLNNYGQLGLNDTKQRFYPEVVPLPLSPAGVASTVVDAQAVGVSSGALLSEGVLLLWGSGTHGKLFHGHGEHVFEARVVKAFEGQCVARFVLTDLNAYAFSPAQVTGLNLKFDPLSGGSDIQISGIGFFDSPSIIVRFQPAGTAVARASVGTFVWDKISGRKYVSAKTPKFPKPGDVVVEVSLNGKDFTANGLGYRCYIQPAFKAPAPRYSNVSGGTRLALEGEGLFESSDVKVRFTDAAENVQVVDGEVVSEYMGKGFNVLTQEEYDEYKVYVACTTPGFLSNLPKPIITQVEVAMNGYYFEPVAGTEPFIYHDAAISSIKPTTIQAEGGTVLDISGSSFFEGLQVRVTIIFGEDQRKSTDVPAMYQSSSLVRCKMPSTRYILGRDETNADSYQATLEITAGTEVLTSPFPFSYYNDPILVASHEGGPVSGGTIVRLSSQDRPILGTSEPLVRFFSEDGALDQLVPATLTALKEPHGPEVYVVDCTAPPCPSSMIPSTPEQPRPVVSYVFSTNGITFSNQVLKFAYYKQPVIKEISPVEGLPGDRVSIKGEGFLASPFIKVKFAFGEGEYDFALSDGTCEGDGTQIACSVPSIVKAPPISVTFFGVAIDGQTYSRTNADNGAKSLLKFTFLDPNKPAKKKK
jgi:hypothetical protein